MWGVSVNQAVTTLDRWHTGPGGPILPMKAPASILTPWVVPQINGRAFVRSVKMFLAIHILPGQRGQFVRVERSSIQASKGKLLSEEADISWHSSRLSLLHIFFKSGLFVPLNTSYYQICNSLEFWHCIVELSEFNLLLTKLQKKVYHLSVFAEFFWSFLVKCTFSGKI